MAFVQVVRRSMRPEEYTDLRFQWLKHFIYMEKYEITDLKVRDARQISENEFEYSPDGFRELCKGDLYYTPDGTAFFEAHVSVPEYLRNKELWLSMWTAAEVIVKVNGRYAGGLDPNRDRLLLPPLHGDYNLKIEMEGYNRSKPDDERNPDAMELRGCRQEFQGLYLSTIRHDVLSLFYDLQLLLDVAKSDYFNEDYRKFLNRELSLALNNIDFDFLREHTDATTGLLKLDEQQEKALSAQIAAATAYIETVIYANDDYKGNGNVAVVGHSHLDLAYYWRKIHTVHKNARTVLIQMRLMDQYPEYKYTHTQAYTYELLEKYYPELFEELKEKVASGNFELTGAMYVEPDCNVPSAESLIRQFLYGQQYFREKFNQTIRNCWLPDVFGNSWILPQIMKKCEVDYFVSNKMSTWNDTNRFPHNNFIWKGIDGSEVYACVPPTHFITWNMPSQIQENWEAYQDKQIGGQTLSMFGYGDGGSGATEEMLELMRRFDKLSVMPKVEHIGAQEFLDNNFSGNTELQTWDGELYLEMHRGTFTTKMDLKQSNRELEFALRDCEILSVLRKASGEEFNAKQLHDTYKMFLVNQFHDILPGSHIHPVFEDAMQEYAKVRKDVNTMHGSGDKWFNSLNYKRTAPVFVEDPDGQIVRMNKKGRFVLPKMDAFALCDALPGLNAVSNWIQLDGMQVETPIYSLEFDEEGSILHLFDKQLNREWVDGVWNKLHFYQDLPGVYDAWDILPNYKEKEVSLVVKQPLRKTYQDDTMAEFTSVIGTNETSWKRIIRLFADSRMIEVENNVDWHETHKLAKAEFGMNILSRELICDTSAGFIKRETHRNTSWQQARFEVCSHKWCDMSETDAGVALINEGQYGVGIEENHITLSLLRATMRPDITSDRGYHDFCYQILPHEGNHVQAKINRFALEQNVPLKKPALSVTEHEGLKALLADLNKAGSNLILQAMKWSEDEKSIIVRLSEQDGRRGIVRMSKKVQPVNMLEDATGELIDVLAYKPFEILTFAYQI